MRELVLLTASTILALAGCTGGDGGDSGGAPDAGTSLKIVVTTDQRAQPMRYELDCDPAGGDHPQPAEACDVLNRAGAKVFDPVPADQVCTSVYGGPQTAKVTGTYDGRSIDATFDRTDGCEINRWEQLGTTVFAVPLQ